MRPKSILKRYHTMNFIKVTFKPNYLGKREVAFGEINCISQLVDFFFYNGFTFPR